MREVREELRWNDARVGKETGVVDKTVKRRLEGETERIPVEWVATFADAAGVSLAWLLTGRGSKAPERRRVVDLVFELQGRVMDMARSPAVSSQDAEHYLEELLRILRPAGPGGQPDQPGR